MGEKKPFKSHGEKCGRKTSLVINHVSASGTGQLARSRARNKCQRQRTSISSCRPGYSSGYMADPIRSDPSHMATIRSELTSSLVATKGKAFKPRAKTAGCSGAGAVELGAGSWELRAGRWENRLRGGQMRLPSQAIIVAVAGHVEKLQLGS